ncbi:hypothetical protein [Hanstruepera flava]|uniref:hypothetical protein n=1 Tax=Hanstruepera flava TaxID=2930218 RepID=UPI002027BC1E|nr:hypothetical protein [Hanstruepera flava]
MKKLLFLFLAFSVMQVSGQTLSSMSKSTTASSSSMIEGLAANQVESLAKKLNLNETQQKQVSGLVVSQLKSEKFQKMLSGIGADKLIGSGETSKVDEQVQNALLLDKDFQKGMSSVLDDKQMKAMNGFTPK